VTPLLGTILVASLAGSLHCLAMCGPLVGLAAGSHSLRFGVLHALGRLATYVALGIAAGAIGRAVDLAGRLADVQHVAAIVAAIVIVGWGIHSVAVARGWWRPSSTDASRLTRSVVRLRSRRPGMRAWSMGLLVGFVPCGWLWAFVVSAAGTGSALGGAAVMATFWLGTVPAMTGLLAIAGPLVARLRARMPVVTSAALVVLALGTLAMRWDNAGTRGVTHPSCHEVTK
jgi:sulfite exporter TauE/SafE